MGNNKIAQHNNLARAPLPLSLYEYTILTRLMARLTADMVESPQTIRISVKEVAGTNKPIALHYELIEKACRTLFDREVNLLPPNATKYSFHLVRIVQHIQHIKGTGYIEAIFSDSIVPYLLELRGWQFYPAEQKPAHVTTERKLPPGVLALELLLQPEGSFNKT